jgi:hypothetical protein
VERADLDDLSKSSAHDEARAARSRRLGDNLSGATREEGRDMSFWDIVWFIVISFAFVAYLMVLFSILGDLFRDRETSGFVKAVWIIALIVFPFLSAFIYVVGRGGGMARRSAEQAVTAKQETDAYIREVAGSATPTEQIAQAQQMLDSGAISRPEFDRLKQKALA